MHAALLSGCTIATPITEPDARIARDGYSFLSPKGESWRKGASSDFINFHEWNPEVESEWSIRIWRHNAESRDISTQELLREEIDRLITPKMHISNHRHRVEVYFDENLRTDCAAIRSVGYVQYFYYLRIGRACRDPNLPRSIVWATCFESRQSGSFASISGKFREQCDRVLQSLEFSKKVNP